MHGFFTLGRSERHHHDVIFFCPFYRAIRGRSLKRANDDARAFTGNIVEHRFDLIGATTVVARDESRAIARIRIATRKLETPRDAAHDVGSFIAKHLRSCRNHDADRSAIDRENVVMTRRKLAHDEARVAVQNGWSTARGRIDEPIREPRISGLHRDLGQARSDQPLNFCAVTGRRLIRAHRAQRIFENVRLHDRERFRNFFACGFAIVLVGISQPRIHVRDRFVIFSRGHGVERDFFLKQLENLTIHDFAGQRAQQLERLGSTPEHAK